MVVLVDLMEVEVVVHMEVVGYKGFVAKVDLIVYKYIMAHQIERYGNCCHLRPALLRLFTGLEELLLELLLLI